MEDDVFGLDVPVNDFAVVHILKGFAYLLDDVLGGGFPEPLLLPEEGVELSGVA